VDQQTLLQLAADELSERALRYRDVEVIDYEPSDPERALLCPVGCLRVFVAAEGDPLLQRLREVAGGGGRADVAFAEEEMAPRFRGRSPLSFYKVWRQLKSSEVFASLRYGGRTLATNVFLPEGLDLLTVDNPYNGGALSPAQLTLVEHVRDGATTALDAVALRHPPQLTEAERAAIDQVPDDQLEANVSVNAGCCDNFTAAVWAVLAFSVAVDCLIPVVVAAEERRHLTDEQVARLGPAASARALLDIRREALGHDH
jgi:hypothetical protein